MSNGIAGIDHIIVGVRDLETARRGWQRLGFTLTSRGRHIGQGTANYCIMFPRDYLELLGFVERDEHAHRLETFLAQHEGAMSLAFAPERDAEATAAALVARGLHPSPPRALGRALELPDGSVTPRFSLLNLPPEETPALDCFICGQLTPELVRRPEWLTHPNGVTGIAAVHLVADDPATLAPSYCRLFGAENVAATGAGIAVDTGRNRLVFSRPALSGGEIPPPAITALELRVASRAAAAAHLKGAGIAFMELPDGRLSVSPAQANGATLLLSEG
ncbi:MAG TPA: VOC family protein [Stellaceae bacterium]|jgi:catechol 2,3-dioxygenase-like lactoylglutathione lyase family enzyme|nr:VOC family protein [Stellaceae bacterium]